MKKIILIIGIIIILFSVSIVSSTYNIVDNIQTNSNILESIDSSAGILNNRTWYLYNAWTPGNTSVIGFYAFGPGDIIRFSEWTGLGDDFFSGGIWTNDGHWLLCTYNNGSLYDINPKTFDVSYIGEGGVSLNGLAYDHVDEILYGATSNDLYEINILSGKSEYIGPFTGGPGLMIGIVCDANGTLYGWDLVMDSLWIIDKETAECTFVGSLGISISYAQDGTVDILNNILYLISYTSGTQIYEVDLDTGACTLVGSLPFSGEFTAIALSYELNMAPPFTTISFDPQISMSGKCWLTDDVKVYLYATDNTGVIDTFYRLNEEEWITYESPFNILSNEEYKIEYFSYDYVGNIEDVKVEYYPEGQSPPFEPTIDGPLVGKPGKEYDYSFNSTDPNKDPIMYFIDWGDNTTEWTEFYDSGEEIILKHIWKEKGSYMIKAKAVDFYGAESNWSEFTVTMPRFKSISILPLMRFLEQYTLLNLILQKFAK